MPDQTTNDEVARVLGEFRGDPRGMAREITRLRRELERVEYELSRVVAQKTLGQA